MEIQPLIVFAGLFIGVLVGLTGMGGGALMTPFLILVGVRPSVAVGTDLFQMMFTKSFGAWQHHRQGAVDYRLVVWLALGSLPGALSGVMLLVVLRDHFNVSTDVLLTRLLGVVLTIVGLALIFRLVLIKRFAHRQLSWEGQSLRGGKTLGIAALGFCVGLLVGLTSVGSGTLFIVLLTVLFPMSMRTIVGTDVAHSALITAGAGVLHMAVGNVDLALAANILIGSVPGVLVGSRLTVNVPERALRGVVAIVLMGVGLNLL